jgi:HK97 family phage major capsid protein
VVSEELIRDEAVQLDAFLAFELGIRIGALQESAFCIGDGSGKPLGLVHASSPYTVVTAATGSSLLYKAADLLAVYLSLPAAYRANASWLVNADDFGKLAGTTDSAGALAFPSLPAVDLRPARVRVSRPADAGRQRQEPGVRRLPTGLRRPARQRRGTTTPR